MTYESALHALADPRRREILEVLRKGPRSVAELARAQPVSRPAVSQHLKVLVAANLVRVEPKGTKRLYHVEPEGLAELRGWLDSFWDDALAALRDEIRRRATADDPKTEAGDGPAR